MQSLTEKLLRLEPPGGVFDESVVVTLFPEAGEGARRQLLFRARRAGEIVLLRRGLYCLDRPFRRSSLHPFVLAAMLLSPSQISCETALAHHALIPEGLGLVQSVCLKRSQRFFTPLGDHGFRRVPIMPLRTGGELVAFEGRGTAFVARPLRALIDLVYLRKDLDGRRSPLDFLVGSLRFDEEGLQVLRGEAWDEYLEASSHRRVRPFLEGLRKELGLP